MVVTELIKTPTVVIWTWDSEVWYDELAAWMKVHPKGKFNILSVGHSTQLVWLEENGDYGRRDFMGPNGEYYLLLLFELADDAMLFKLTWIN
jgi:hypothetical protein